MILKVFKKSALDEEHCKICISLIRRRFKKRWGIDRKDITIEMIQCRINAVAYDGNRIVGFLGMEDTGELVNGCAEKEINGIYLLAKLARKIVEENQGNAYFYFAYFPIKDLAIPYSSFIATKGYLSISSKIIRKKYDNKEISLRKIKLFTDERISKSELLKKLKEE